MHRVTLDMELSCDDAFASVEQALGGMLGVHLSRHPSDRGSRIMIAIDSDDLDVVDIVREIAWEYDPKAVQHSAILSQVRQ